MDRQATEQTALLLKLKQEIEERTRTEDMLRRYELIISTVRDPMSFLDRKYIYQAVNRAYTEFLRKPIYEIVGHSVCEMVGREAFEKKIKHHLDRCLAGEEIHYQNWFDFPGKGTRFMDIRYYPLVEKDGSVSGVVASPRDMTDLKQAQKSLEKRTHELGERVKELNCLYSMFKVMEQAHLSWNEVFQGIVNLLPPSWQYSEISCARLVIDGREFKTDNFRETPWKQEREIDVYGEKCGLLQICYLEDMPESDEGPFMKEEGALLTAVADHLGKDIEHKRLHEHLEHTNRRLKTEYHQRKKLSKVLLKSLERDRKRIAMELHDQIGQTLTSLKMSLEMLYDRANDEDTKLKSELENAREKTAQVIREVKNVSHGLRPAMLDTLGLESALRELFNEIENQYDIEIQFFSRNVPKHFDKEKEITLYRVTQEALNNAVKYARSEKVFVTLVKKGKRILLTIEDNGIGFNPDEVMENQKDKKLGLLFMRERIKQFDGEFNIESRENRGTLIMAEIEA